MSSKARLHDLNALRTKSSLLHYITKFDAKLIPPRVIPQPTCELAGVAAEKEAGRAIRIFQFRSLNRRLS